jgi:hypothetical protein
LFGGHQHLDGDKEQNHGQHHHHEEKEPEKKKEERKAEVTIFFVPRHRMLAISLPEREKIFNE